MANRCLLSMNRVYDFRKWLEKNGYEIVETKGIFEILRAVKGNEKVIIYKRLNSKEHCTVPDANVRIVKKFINETREEKA